MHVAVVHPYPWPEVRRGAERYLDDLAAYLAAAGHEVTIVTGTHDAPGSTVDEAGVTCWRLHHITRGGRLQLGEVETFGARALQALVRLRPDVVHAFTPSAALAGRLALRPTLYTVLGHPAADQMPDAAIPRWLFESASRRATVTATLSHASADALADLVGRRGVVLPPGVRSARFPAELAPRGGPPRLLLSASLSDRRKRAELAVAVLALVLARHPEARLRLSGEGDPGWVLAAADELGPGVRAAVEVLGPGSPEDVPARYRDASVTLLPSEHEAFGLALVESLASGTPVVCPRAGGMPEIVGDPAVGVGVVADEATAAALAGAVERALCMAADPATPPRCVARAERWSWEATVGPAHVRLYESMVAGAPMTEAVGPW